MKPNTYRLELEPLPPRPGPEPSKDEILASYRAACPTGEPPLSAVREYVIEAWRRSRASVEVADPLSACGGALDLRLLLTQADDFAALPLDGNRPSDFVAEHPALWFDAAAAVSAVERMLSHVEDARGPRGRRLFAPDDVRESVASALRAVEELLREAARGSRRFRLVPDFREISLDEQMEALATAGVHPRAGTPRERLCFNWSAEDIAAAPWRRLSDFIECSDDVVTLAYRCLEGEEDRDTYARFAARMGALAKGRLPLTAIESDVNFEACTAFVRFELDGASHRWDLEWNGRWVDTAFMVRLDALLRKRARGWAFYALAFDLEHPTESGTYFCLQRDAYLRLRAGGAPVVPLAQG